MENLLYEKKVDCPCCKNVFVTQKVRMRRLKVLERHPDFYVKYKDIQPIYYQVWVCPNCGFSATESGFVDLTRDQRAFLKEKVSSKWNQRDFGGVRSFEEAEESYKLALLIAQLLKMKKGYIGSLCLKLAWLYRGCQSEKELEFLKHALNYLETAYQTEPFPIAGLDEVSLSYLVGELHRRFNNINDAIKWYGKALDHPDIKRNRQIQLMAREQWYLAREQHRAMKEEKANGN